MLSWIVTRSTMSRGSRRSAAAEALLVAKSTDAAHNQKVRPARWGKNERRYRESIRAASDRPDLRPALPACHSQSFSTKVQTRPRSKPPRRLQRRLQAAAPNLGRCRYHRKSAALRGSVQCPTRCSCRGCVFAASTRNTWDCSLVRGTADAFDLFRQAPPRHPAVRSQGSRDR